MTRRSKIEDLTQEQYSDLVARLYAAQDGLCYICQKPIDQQVHKVDIDHIIALDRSGPDDESNWGLTHANCNRAKGNRDLQLIHFAKPFLATSCTLRKLRFHWKNQSNFANWNAGT